MKILFSIGSYDKDGDLTENEELLYLHIDKLRFEIGHLSDLDTLVAALFRIKKEVQENYNFV